MVKFSIKDDLKLYPCYLYRHRSLLKIPPPETWNSAMQMHHFVRQSIRKNSPDFYKRVEHLQKLILMPAAMNYDLETMGEIKFFEKYGVNKNDLVFSRKKWREKYYDTPPIKNYEQRRIKPMEEKTRKTSITPKEKKIIELVALGYTDREIAAHLNSTYSSIRNIFGNLLIKTGTVNRPHLVSWAYRENIMK